MVPNEDVLSDVLFPFDLRNEEFSGRVIFMFEGENNG